MTEDRSDEVWEQMQEGAWQRGETPPVVNKDWWELACAARRLKAALSGFLEYAERAEQGGEEPTDHVLVEDLTWIRQESEELVRLMAAELTRRRQGSAG